MSERSATRAWAAAAVVVTLVVCGTWFATLERLLRTGEIVARAPAEAIERLGAAARGLLSGDVTTRFLSSLPEVEAPRAGRLELAVATTTETFQRTDERRALWDLVPLGSTTVEIRVPVVWRYHVPMDGAWQAIVEGDRMTVVAPPLRPSLPPALRTDRMERRSESGWLRFDAEEQMARLEREIVPLLVARARDPRHLALVREPARRALAEFAHGWLAGFGAWGAEAVNTIEVRFADEPESEAVPAFRFGSGAWPEG
ncbi:MAG TPA: hypothetical protein VLA66_11765 [Thermoanaerobaculia bacterium]|nr:hypothetical protein [Thermoanaerobaculia bacterium]